MESTPLITNDAVVLGILMSILALVFWTSSQPGWKRFYTFVPSLLLCYFIPSLFSTLGIISGDVSNLYFVSSRYLLPTSLVLLTLSINLKEVLRLEQRSYPLNEAIHYATISGSEAIHSPIFWSDLYSENHAE